MQRPLKITSRDFTLSEAFDTEIRQKVAKLDNYHNGIVGCEVVIEAPVYHHRKGGPYNVRIDLTLPGTELVVNRQKEENLAAAIREAFDAARRRLEDHARAQRGDVKTHEAPPLARVIKLLPQDGYGFLETADGREVYFHRNSVLEPGFDHLKIGSDVHFVEELGAEGPQASTVTILHKHPTTRVL
ncbi:MAG: HPF/RaiA family ribosome-associated protein [Candidatus Binataceae bacterium]|jgi:ribosomal subunit interface protein